MKTVRVKNLVAIANRTRQELATGLPPRQLTALRKRVEESVRFVAEALAKHRANEVALPPPSRRAYLFLKSLDFDAIQPVAESDGTARTPPNSISYPGLRRFLDEAVDRLARMPPDAERASIHGAIRSTSQKIEDGIRDAGVSAHHLTRTARDYRGWLAYMAEPENFDAYITALRRAQPAFEAAARGARGVVWPLLIHFRPMKGLCRMRAGDGGTRVWLPTHAMHLGREAMEAAGGLAFDRSRPDRPVIEALASGPCREALAQIERLGGLVREAAGVYHDLDAAFDRVCAEYFGGAMSRPRLAWSRSFTRRKLGHYNQLSDALMVSATLDRPDAPPCVIDYVVYHELLHKKFGLRWNGTRQAVHTAQFAQEEKRFRDYGQAQEALKRLLGGAGLD